MKAAGNATRRNRNSSRNNGNNRNAAKPAKNMLSRKVRRAVDELLDDVKAGRRLPPRLKAYLCDLIREDLDESPANESIFNKLQERSR
jgi:hypothetical protein